MKKIYALLTSALIAAGLRAQSAPTVSKETQLQPKKPSSIDTLIKPKTTTVSRKSGEGQKEFLKTAIKETVVSKDQKIITDQKIATNIKQTTDIKLSKDQKISTDIKETKNIKLSQDQKLIQQKITQPDLKMQKEAVKTEQIKRAVIKK